MKFSFLNRIHTYNKHDFKKKLVSVNYINSYKYLFDKLNHTLNLSKYDNS